jgi:hypothetical protein
VTVAVFWDELSRRVRRMSVEEVVEEIDGKTSGSNAKEHSEFARSGFTEFFLHDAYEPTVISINGNPS